MCQQPSGRVVQFPPEEAFFLGRKFMLMIFKLLELLRQLSSWPTLYTDLRRSANFGFLAVASMTWSTQEVLRERFQHPHFNTITGFTSGWNPALYFLIFEAQSLFFSVQEFIF